MPNIIPYSLEKKTVQCSSIYMKRYYLNYDRVQLYNRGYAFEYSNNFYISNSVRCWGSYFETVACHKSQATHNLNILY